jgi:hypothetical protein
MHHSNHLPAAGVMFLAIPDEKMGVRGTAVAVNTRQSLTEVPFPQPNTKSMGLFTMNAVYKTESQKHTLQWHSGSQKTLQIAVFRNVAPCSLVGVYKRFGGTCCLHVQGSTQLLLLKTPLFSVCTQINNRGYIKSDTAVGGTEYKWKTAVGKGLLYFGSCSQLKKRNSDSKVRWLMMCRKTIFLYSKNQTKSINALCERYRFVRR